MRAAGLAGRADAADRRAGNDALTDLDIDPRQVRVTGPDALAVGDEDHLAPPAAARTGEDDSPGTRRGDRGSRSSRKVDTRVEPCAARPEPVSDRPREWAAQPERRSGLRCAQRRDCGRSRHAVGPDSGPSLEA